MEENFMISKLNEFQNNYDNSLNKEQREKNLSKLFMDLAKYLIYGGYFQCSNRYNLYITSVEFYFHEERQGFENRIVDPIMYHRNKKWKTKTEIQTPAYFKVGTLYPHQSGIDITFEKSEEYRASALIRSFNINKQEKDGKLIEDDRSTFVYDYFFDGYSVEGSNLKWIPINDSIGELHQYARKNVNVYKIIDFDFDSNGLTEGKHYRYHDGEYVKMLTTEDDVRKWRFVKIGSKFDKEYRNNDHR